MAYILLVEDDPIALKVHYLMLKKLNCEINCAVNGSQALEQCLNNYDLILMDCGLPDMDGFEVSKKIRHLEKSNQILPRPIIMLSAYSLDKYLEEECASAEINRFIAKPIKYEDLRDLVSCYLSIQLN